ncbi:class I adenylate-forming enzyme family protein [Kitasatospora sp. NPDC059646]|uniref:class I adenylate-forming enzyme family protein n=1 Tax=Kitasatospora sp. NPDC059646 TaxID=3346893 RepID=UPI0036BF9B65
MTRPADDCYALAIVEALAADPDRTAVHWRGQDVPAGRLARRVADTVHALRKLGVGPGSTVAVLVSPNSPVMLTVRYAAHLLGGAVTYVRGTNPGSTAYVLSPDAQLRILFDSSAQVLFTDAENLARARQLADRAPGRFVLAEEGRISDDGAAPLAADRAGLLAELGELPARDPEELALLSFSSGSTGKPKGVCVTTRVWERTVLGTLPLVGEPDPRLLVATPLSFVVGPVADAVLRLGGLVVLHEGFDAAQAVDAIARHGITRTFMATPHLYRTMEVVKAGGTDLSTLKALIYTGVMAAPAKLEEAAALLGPVLLQAYGSAEAGRISILLPGEHDDPRLRTTVGRPFPEVELRIVDQESGGELPAGEVGEVWVRSPNLMAGYLGDPALTSRVLQGGWYRTGDIGHLDEQGYLSLVDRVADVVKTDGVKIYPAVVEREIATLPGVADAAVYGIRDRDNLEHVHAAVVLKPGAQRDAAAIRARIGSVLTPVHAPEEIRFLDELPLGISGKPDKNVLRERFPLD